MQDRVPYTELVTLFPAGTVLWRGCQVFERGVRPRNYDVADIPLARSGTEYVFRIHAGGNAAAIYEPVVAGEQERGIVCFIKQRPPAGWTHLVVTRIATGGRALFAEWTDSLPMAEYMEFRHRYYQATKTCQPGQELYVAQRQRVGLPPDLHRGYFHHLGDGMWDVECPLQEAPLANLAEVAKVIGNTECDGRYREVAYEYPGYIRIVTRAGRVFHAGDLGTGQINLNMFYTEGRELHGFQPDQVVNVPCDGDNVAHVVQTLLSTI